MDLVIRLMTLEDVHRRMAWRYPPPYDVYDVEFTDPDVDADWLLLPENHYHAILRAGELIGFCCYGPDAQVPGGDYSVEALDVGIGLRPDRTGQGLGTPILQAVLELAVRTWAPRWLRTTIVAWNRCSIRTFERLGFTQTATFRTANHAAGNAWIQLMKPGVAQQ